MVAEIPGGNLREGDHAPDFELLSLQGKVIKLSDYRGKKLILFVWASW